MKFKFVLFPLIILSFLLTGCYFNEEASASQVAVHMDRNQITRIEPVPGGVYTDMSYYSDLLVVDVSTLTFSVEDPEVLTKDDQAVGVRLTIQARRKGDEASLKNLITNWNSLVDNQALIDTITATAREGMKNGVRGFTLPELLNDRNNLAEAIVRQLQSDTAKYSVEIINVTVENIAASPEYMTILSQTANLKAQTEQEKQRQTLINQKAANDILQAQKDTEVANAQVSAEEAKTAVQVEIASREGEKIAAANQVYADNPAAYRLRQMELMQGILGDNVIYFIPEGTDLSLFLDKLLSAHPDVAQ